MFIALSVSALFLFSLVSGTLLRRRAVLAARSGSVVLAAVAIGSVLGARSREPDEFTWGWIPAVNLNMHLVLDDFAAVMVCLVAGLGALVLWYSVDYFSDHRAYPRFVSLFVAFAAAMIGVVASGDLFSMFIFWELTSVLSFLLIGMNDESASARSAALRALLTTGLGGLCLLVGVALFQVGAGTSSFAELAASDGGGAMFATAAMFAMIGALTKSAQFPFHFWLPGAMSAPTPVSAYLHSATMVKAGIVLMARLAPAVDGVAAWRWTAVVLGGVTMVWGGARALAQTDAKLLLAHSTVSQLGFLTVLVGMGNPVALYAGVAHFVAHALFKAGLFLSVGIVDHATGTRDIRTLSGVGRSMPFVAGCTIASAASMAGVIPLLGFATKEKALATLLKGGGTDDVLGSVALVLVLAGAVLSAAYSVRFIRGVFFTKPGVPATEVHHGPSIGLVAPMAATVVVSVGAGLAAGWWGRLIAPAARALDVDAKGALALWPGVNTALVASIVVLGIGLVVGSRVPLDPARAGRGNARWTGERIFQAVYDGVLGFCSWITRFAQSGSLSVYNMVVLGIVVLAAGIPAASLLGEMSGETVLADSVPQAVLALLGAAFALAAARTTRRFVSALMLGGLGFSCAVIFALFGAPDLAITQLLVECLVIVVVLLVLRQMPRHFETEEGWIPRWIRLAVSVGVGASVAVFALSASLSRTAPSVGDEYLARSVPEGAGRNVVNVILVDFRGTDTLGEVLVLLVAGLGIAQLVRTAPARMRRGRATAEGAQ